MLNMSYVVMTYLVGISCYEDMKFRVGGGRKRELQPKNIQRLCDSFNNLPLVRNGIVGEVQAIIMN